MRVAAPATSAPELGSPLPIAHTETCAGAAAFAETVRLFAAAAVVIGAHGAGLSNMLYARQAPTSKRKQTSNRRATNAKREIRSAKASGRRAHKNEPKRDRRKRTENANEQIVHA
jgi:capsular polysaccharide biosynthesis protein